MSKPTKASNRFVIYAGVTAIAVLLANTFGANWPIGLPVAILSGALVGLLFSVRARWANIEARVLLGVIGSIAVNIIACDAKFAGYEPAMRGILGASVVLVVAEIVKRNGNNPKRKAKKDRHNPRRPPPSASRA